MTEDHVTGHDGPAYPSATDGEAAPEFTPSASFTVDDDGRRDIGLCFVGDSFTVGFGDPKALGWVGRVVSRTHHPDVEITAYNLGVRGQDSGDVMARWRGECMPRWVGRGERRLVVAVGANDLGQGLTTARSRLNLANILDDASAKGIATFVVGLTPSLDPELNARIGVLAQAQAMARQSARMPLDGIAMTKLLMEAFLDTQGVGQDFDMAGFYASRPATGCTRGRRATG